MNPPVTLWSWSERAVRDAHGVTHASASDLNLLSDDIDAIVGVAGEAPAVVVRSGWTHETPLAGELPWSARVRSLLDERLARLIEKACARNVRVWLRPQHADVISDIPSTLQVLRAQSHAELGLWLEPSALLAESMLSRAGEHLARITEALAVHPRCVAVDLSGFEKIGLEALADCARTGVTARKPLVAPQGQADAQFLRGLFAGRGQ